jgi:predicted phosphodiesterase
VRYLIISDLHSNWEALQAVLDAAKGQYDRIVSCGDLVGYGPDPNRVVDWARKNLAAVIRGNHDRCCAGLEDLEWFNPIAKAATIWTMGQLSEDNIEYLRRLPAGPLQVNGFHLIHGSPLDEDEYVITATDARNIFDYLEAGITFFGHTHLQGGYAYTDGCFQILPPLDPFIGEIRYRLDPEGIYLINPGSTGQPRDGDPRAAFAVFDAGASEVLQRRVPYDCEKTRRRIEAAGLPDVLGARLLVGR